MKDQKPAVWVGHVFVKSTDVPATTKFLETIGVRNLMSNERMGVFELRAGTHIVLQAGAPESDDRVYFDLMVDNLDESHQHFTEHGLEPGAISRGNIHDEFMMSEPGGNTFRFNSSHVSKYPV